MKVLLGKKIGMISITSDNGAMLPVTLLQAGPCVITQIKTLESDGYSATQIGFEESKKTIKKPQKGHLRKSKSASRYVREFKEFSKNGNLGDVLDVSNFSLGDKITVSSISKGKGFAGTVKRHNFKTGPKSHGSQNVRKPGSIGSMYPQKVFKGKRMAGQMGATRVTEKNLEVVLIDSERNVLGVKGAVPGPRKCLVEIRGRSE